MYIGPWQEFRLSQAVGGQRRRRFNAPTVLDYPAKKRLPKESDQASESARSAASITPRSASTFSVASDSTYADLLSKINPGAIEQLVNVLSQATKGGEEQRDILEQFLSEQREQQAGRSSFELDPFRARMIEEKNKERRLVQIRRERVPPKLGQLERRRADFAKHLRERRDPEQGPESELGRSDRSQAHSTSQNNAVEKEEEQKLIRCQVDMGGSVCQDDSASPGILPTQPALLLNSFLPAAAKASCYDRCSKTRSPKMEHVGFSHDRLGIPFLSNEKEDMKRYYGQEPLTRLPNFPCIASTNASAVSKGVKDYDGLVRVSQQRQQQQQQQRQQQQALEKQGELVLPNQQATLNDCLPSPLATLMDDDVDDLVNWSKQLGISEFDDYLFHED